MMDKRIWFIAAAVLLAWLLGGKGCETAQSYCADVYRDGGRTPRYLAGYFHDYDSCVRWYEENEPAPGEHP